MDCVEEEDVSARVLLRNVLHTEAQRSPVTRSVARDQRLSRVRRSSRLRNPCETPQAALRHKLKQKLHETASQSPLPPSKRARTPGRTLETPSVLPSPALYDDDVTPRGLLRGIIQTEAEASLLLSGQTALHQGDQQDVEASIHSNRRSDGVSGLELPDLATEPLTHMIRGMSRRRPPPTFNISTFEKQLEQPSADEEEMDVPQESPDVSQEQDLSAGSKSVLSLTLKTPFVNLRSERAGLRRKAAGRRKQVSVDAFDEAVQKRLERHQNQDYTVMQDGRSLQDSNWRHFTLGLSNVTVPELTTDMLMHNTELYAQPQASVSQLTADGGATDAEMKRDDGDVREDVTQDQQSVCEGSISKPQPDPSENPLPDSHQSQEEEDEVEIPPSQENMSLCPEDIPFAPTQAMVEHVPQPQEQEQCESAVREKKVEEMDQSEGESIQEDQPSRTPQRITRRAYHSEGGAIRNDVVAGGRGTKSLGMGQDPTETCEKTSEEQKSVAAGSKLFSMEEETYRSPASSSAVHTSKPSSSETHQDSLEPNAAKEDIQDLDQSESEEVVVSVDVSPSVNVPATAEEEEEQDEEEEEQQHQEEDEDEEEKQQHQEDDEQEQEDEEEKQQHQEEDEEEQEDEDEDAQSEELSMQTPGFIRQRKQVSTPGALATPTVLKALNAGPSSKVVKPHPKRKPKRVPAGILPKSYVMSVFKHFAKTNVASDVYPVINDILQRYFDRLADDLEAYSAHAKRKTIEVEDVELLMRRQGFVTDSTPVNVLIEKFLPLEYRKLLIPVATSGNKVVPDQRR